MKNMTTAQREGANLATRFKQLKEEAGITKAEFARRYKVPGGPSMISQNISGHRPIGLEQAAAYMQGFGCSIEEISPSLSARIPSSAIASPAAEQPSTAASSNVTPLPVPRRAVDTLTELQALVNSLTPLLRDAGLNVLQKWLNGQASAAEAAAVLEQLQQISAGAMPGAENRAA